MKTRIFTLCIAFAFAAATLGCKAKAPETKTIANLKSAITGETSASIKYAAYAKKAKEEGFSKIAILFEAASKAEGIHAKKHTEVLAKAGVTMDAIDFAPEVKSTKENLEDALKGETHEIDSIYPDYIKQAVADNNADAVTSFTWAMDVEKKHQALYKKAIAALAKKDLAKLAHVYMVCGACGNTVEKEAPAICDVCGEPKDKFIAIK